MNLIVQTRNYTIKSEDGKPLAEGLNELTLSGTVDKDGIAIFKELLKAQTLELMTEETENT
ncbi:hypothetical protein [Chryseobacterium sp. JK1]|uniref:hypothetical protein n=1 Tax=Chryseobacterium sp. JK1 TaxID=874294 RepID=UPI003D684FEE